MDSQEFKSFRETIQSINKWLKIRFLSKEPSIHAIRSSNAARACTDAIISGSLTEASPVKQYFSVFKRNPVHVELSAELKLKDDRYFNGDLSSRGKRKEIFKGFSRLRTSKYVVMDASRTDCRFVRSLKQPFTSFALFAKRDNRMHPKVMIDIKANTEVSFHKQPESKVYLSSKKPQYSAVKEPSKDLKAFMNKSMNFSNIEVIKTHLATPPVTDLSALKKKTIPNIAEASIFMPKKSIVGSVSKLHPNLGQHLKELKEPKDGVFDHFKKAQKLSILTDGSGYMSPEEKQLNLLAKARNHLNKKKDQSSTSCNHFKPIIGGGRQTPFRQYLI